MFPAGQRAPVQSLNPRSNDDAYFTADLAASGDGSWLAVSGAQRVRLWRREGSRFVERPEIRPLDYDAGLFGDAIAFDGTGSTLLGRRAALTLLRRLPLRPRLSLLPAR